MRATARPAGAGAGTSHRQLTVAACVSMAVFAASVTVPSVCLQELGTTFGLSYADRGALSSLRMVALVAMLLTSGALADRVGKRPFLVSGLMLIGLGLAATAGAGAFPALLAAQLLVGVGSGSIEALVNPLIADLNPGQAARLLNVVNGLFSLGVVVAAIGAGELLQAGGSWRVAFLACVLPAFAGAALFAVRGYPAPGGKGGDAAPSGQPDRSHLRGLVTRPAFWLLMVAMLCGGGMEAGMTVWGANFAQQEVQASARGGAWTIAFFGAFMAAGRFASGALVSRLSAWWLMMASAVGGALATAGLYSVQGLGMAWVLFALGGLFVACFWPTLLAVAAERLQDHSSLLFALMAAAGISGCALVPWGIGLLGDAAGLRAGVLLLPATMVIEAVALLALGRGPAGGDPRRDTKAHEAHQPAQGP